MADVTYSTIHVADGQELGDTPLVFVQPAGKHTPRNGETLIAFFDMPSATASTCSEIAHTLSDGFWRAPGGLTTAMRLAIKLANDRLVELNRGVPSSQRAQGSISCAVINHESVIIAQAGPAVAYARSQAGAFERVTPVGSMEQVGTSRNIDAFFTHYAWKPGDAFVLTGDNSCVGVSDQLVNACMGKGDARMVAGYLNANVKSGEMTGVAFTVAGAPVTLSESAPITAEQDIPPTPPSTIRPVKAGRSTPTAEPQTPLEKQPTAFSKVGQAAASGLGQAGDALRKGLGKFGAQLLPSSTARTTPAQRSRATVFGLAAAAILVPIVVSLLVAILYIQLSGEAEKQQLLNVALAQVAQAKSSNSVNDWSKAVDMIKDYENKYPNDVANFADAKQQAQGQLDQVGKITRVAAVPITDLGESNAPRRIAASSIGVYVLEQATGLTQYYVLTPQRNGISGKPMALTSTGGVTSTGTIINDLSWASPSGGRWRVEGAILFSKSNLYEYNSASAQLSSYDVPSGTTSAQTQIVAGELYNNTAYLLDNGVGQIWRYSLQGNTLSDAGPYFRASASQLRDAIDFAIDGSIYILMKNGSVLKYYGRDRQTYTLSGLPQPMGKAVAIAISGNDTETGNVFVADSDNGAIWMFDKKGAFQKQWRASNDEFIGMQDMSLDPTSNTIFINTATKLYSFKVS
jgi:hypothetical protein